MAHAKVWAFAPDFPESRRISLEAYRDFEAIVDLLLRSMTDVRVSVDPGVDHGMVECLCPIVTFSARGAFDAFFNSACGYRAQFWHDPEDGQAANNRLVRRIFEGLDDTSRAELKRLCNFDVAASFAALSAKIWVHEDDFPMDRPTEDLAVEPWLTAARNGVKEARFGLCAPAEARLKAMGGFIDNNGHERVSKFKIRRRFHIHDYGYS